MDTAGYILIGLGAGLLVIVAIILVVRWYIERKKQRAIAHKDLVERSFVSQQGSVCHEFTCSNHRFSSCKRALQLKPIATTVGRFQ